jgi:hypothetical protein
MDKKFKTDIPKISVISENQCISVAKEKVSGREIKILLPFL